MRVFKIFTAFLFLLLTAVFPAPGQARGVWEETRQVEISAGAREVRTVRVNLSDPSVEVRPVLAGGAVGLTAPLSEMASGAGAVAAINGTFFNAYSDNQPQGTVMIDEFCHHLADGATIGFTGAGAVVDRLRPEIKGGINGSRQWPNGWYAWSVNSPKAEGEAIVVYTPSFSAGVSRPPGYKSVVVRSGVVTGIESGVAGIPSDGYVIGFGPGSAGDAGKFRVGDGVEYSVNLGSGWDRLKHAISAGPLLLKGGRIVLDYDGMEDPKITTYSGARSFIGVTGDNLLVMGTTPAATIKELAEITRVLGLTEAMNLDGGASSGLLFEGRYITQPGRSLSNCLVVVEKPLQQVKIQVNGEPVTGFSPYIAPPGITMVPVRGLFEKVGAGVQWNEATRTVTVSTRSAVISLQVGSSTGMVNGRPAAMPRPAEIMDGRTYIPLRFIAENLGARVLWDEGAATVRISI